MSDRLWIAALLYPAPLYAGLLVLVHFAGGGVGLAVGFLLAIGFGTVTGLGLIRFLVWVWLGRLVLVLLVLLPLTFELDPGGGEWLDLAAGVVIGSPFLWLEYAWRDASTPAARVVALQSTFVLGLLCLASGASGTSASGGWPFFEAFGNVLLLQVQGLAALLGGVIPTGIPLEATLDVTYAALGGVALLGVMLSGISPRTALEEPLPWSWLPGPYSRVSAPTEVEVVGLRPGQRDVLETRTRPLAPNSVLAPGLGSLLVTAALLVGFIALAVAAPSYALLVLTLASVGAMFAVGLVLARRLNPLGGLEG
ncbi:MAG: hypothetical protein ACLP8Y_01450 [Thermoplasmata archaeon]